jgi:hypothetical protein
MPRFSRLGTAVGVKSMVIRPFLWLTSMSQCDVANLLNS